MLAHGFERQRPLDWNIDPQLCERFGEQGLVDDGKGGNERPLLADNHDLFEQGILENRVFEIAGRDFLAGRGDDDVLDPALDDDLAVAFERPVARMQPAVLAEDAGFLPGASSTRA